jgi:hypothetical protein
VSVSGALFADRVEAPIVIEREDWRGVTARSTQHVRMSTRVVSSAPERMKRDNQACADGEGMAVR